MAESFGKLIRCTAYPLTEQRGIEVNTDFNNSLIGGLVANFARSHAAAAKNCAVWHEQKYAQNIRCQSECRLAPEDALDRRLSKSSRDGGNSQQ